MAREVSMVSPETPAICVVITAHNYGHYLDQCIQSVLVQKDPPSWCLMVIDDGSTDETPYVLEKYSQNPHIVVLRLNGVGLACAGNRGISLSRSEWVIRLDADDWLEPDALRTLYDGANQAGADVAYGDLHLVSERGLSFGVLSQSSMVLGRGLERAPVGSGMLYRRSVWEEISGYDESLRYQEDFDFWLKVSERCTVVHVARALYAYRQHGASMSTNRRPRFSCRAQVKRSAAIRRGLTTNGGVLAVVDAVPPFNSRISSMASIFTLDGVSLIERTLNQLSSICGLSKIVVRADNSDVQEWVRNHGLQLIDGGVNFAGVSDPAEQHKLSELGNFAVVLGCNPYFPLLESYRYQETLDTLVLGGYSRVDIVISDPNESLMPAADGWTSIGERVGYTPQDCRWNKVASATGTTAARMGAYSGGRGCVEIASPEDQVVRDADSLRVAEFVWHELLKNSRKAGG